MELQSTHTPCRQAKRIVAASFMPADWHTAAYLEEEAKLQAALVVQVVRAAHAAVHVLHAQREALLGQLRQLRCADGVPVGQGALCAIRRAQVPASAQAGHVRMLIAMYAVPRSRPLCFAAGIVNALSGAIAHTGCSRLRC